MRLAGNSPLLRAFKKNISLQFESSHLKKLKTYKPGFF